MPETQLLIDNLKYGSISIDSAKIKASNSILYITAELHLHPIKPFQHFNIDVIEYSLLLESSPLSKSQNNIHLDSRGPILKHDINFEFMIPINNIKKIDEWRKDGDIELGLNLNFYLDLLPIEGSKIEGKKTSPTRLSLKIFRSQWEDIILPAFGYSKEDSQNEPSKKKRISILSKVKIFFKENWDRIIQLGFYIWSKLRHLDILN